MKLRQVLNLLMQYYIETHKSMVSSIMSHHTSQISFAKYE
uniref:Uncharacterized protein n=1 Tax=Rhizophora mucronata TaxID=61149 RepID=A0A2P2PRQ2_RHIMU